MAGGPDARAARRVGARVATAACWLLFALAFVAGRSMTVLTTISFLLVRRLRAR